jgi:hypothetical protein
VAVVKKTRAIIYKLFPKLNTANVKLYFTRYRSYDRHLFFEIGLC